MSLVKGDHLVIKRNGMILTPDVGEGHHEFEVVNADIENRLIWPDGTPVPTAGDWWQGKTLGVDYFEIKVISVKVVR